jgi:hypothetical protein
MQAAGRAPASSLRSLPRVRAAKLPRELGRELHESVRAKFDELWLAAASAPAGEDY